MTLKEALQKLEAALTCGEDGAHYCPNCDNSLFNAREIARTALLPKAPAIESERPVAYRYRWKLDGEWTKWRVSDASQKSQHLIELEEQPLYARPALPQDGIAEAEDRRLAAWAAVAQSAVSPGQSEESGVRPPPLNQDRASPGKCEELIGQKRPRLLIPR